MACESIRKYLVLIKFQLTPYNTYNMFTEDFYECLNTLNQVSVYQEYIRFLDILSEANTFCKMLVQVPKTYLVGNS